MGLINKVDMVCLSPVGYGVKLTFRALALRRSSFLVASGLEACFKIFNLFLKICS